MMTTCPGREQLSGYVLGLLPEGAFEEIAEHVEHCAVCEATVLTLEGTPDTVVSVLRQPVPADPVLAERACQRAVEQIRALASDSLVDAPPTGIPLETPTPSGSDERLDFLAPAKSSDELGRLGSYRVLKQLGAGGMGVVFLAEDIHLKRRAALKVMHPQATAKRGARERFLREAQAAATLEHEHIVTIFQVGEERGMPYLAMQLLKGMSLEDRLRRAEGVRPPALLSIPQILRLGRQIARGLAAAHERGLIHRDIKPANLWLEPEHGGHIKILDFGLARAVEDEAHLTQSGAIVGTPAYMAPEQARSERVDHRCDLFSLGVVLYRLCTGRLPFRGDSTMAVLTALAMDAPKQVSDLNPTLPPELAELVMQLLNKHPAQRPASAKEVAERLHALERTLTVPVAMAVAIPVQPAAPANPWADIDVTEPIGKARPESVARPGSAKGVETPQRAGPRPSQTPGVPPRRRRVLLAAVAAAAMILLAGITIRIATDKGELVIKADESVEVTIKRNGKPVEDLELKKGPNVTSVYSGDIEVVLKGANADEFVIKNNRITLKRGDKPMVEIERRPPTARAVDADRKAAEWVLSVGGAVRVLADGKLVDVSKAENLPKRAFRIKRVNIAANPRVQDAALEHLSGLAELEELDMHHNPQLGNDSLKPLAHLTTLRVLVLKGSAVNDAGLEALRDIKNLQSMGLGACAITDAGMRHIAKLTELQHLDLRATQLTDAGMAHLRNLTKLESIGVSSPKIAGPGYDHLKALPKLRRLDLAGKVQPSIWKHVGQLDTIVTLILNESTADDAALAQLKGMTKLVYMEAHRTEVTDAGLKHLLDLPSLTGFVMDATRVTPQAYQAAVRELAKRRAKRESDPDRRAAEWVLSIGGTVTIRAGDNERVIAASKNLPAGALRIVGIHLSKRNAVDDKGMECLRGLAHVQKLELHGTSITDRGLSCLQTMEDLRWLDLSGLAVTDAGLANLENLTKLTNLSLQNTQVSDAGLAHLKGLTSLMWLALNGTPVRGPGLIHLKGLTKLAELDLTVAPVGDAGLVHLKELTNLNRLYLWGTNVSDAGLEQLKGLTNLTTLDLTGTFVTDAGLAHLKGLTNLTEIILNSTRNGLPVSDAGLDHLKELTKLTRLNLNGSQVTDAGLVCLKGLTNLTRLDLARTRLGDSGLEHLKVLSKLTWLDLADTRVNGPGLAYLKGLTNLTELGIANTDVSDAGLEHLKGLTNLKGLSLSGTRVSGAGLVHLKGLTKLTELRLGTSTLTDLGLKHVAELTRLEKLSLAGSSVSDDGLKHLHGLYRLKELDLTGTKVTAEAVAALAKALPKCKVAWDGAK
jgi:serine/threonine protein kinase/Leucine-rich repeat (LRR) protein